MADTLKQNTIVENVVKIPNTTPYNTSVYRHLNCKVIRIGKRVQPDISKARQQVNIDRPAYNKTDKQCRTRTTITARLPDG